MIRVTKMDGNPMILNAEWIQSVENTPDTVVTLTNGQKIIVRERVEDIVEKYKNYKREIQAIGFLQSLSGVRK